MTLQALLDDLTKSRGALTAVIFIETYPTFEGILVFSDGTTLEIGAVQGTGLVGGFKFGYSGTGPDAFSRFLSLAGFADVAVNTRTLPIPLKLMKDGTRILGERLQASIRWEDGSETPATEHEQETFEPLIALGIQPEGADAWATLACAECGQPAVTVALIGDQLAIATELEYAAQAVSEARVETLRALVERADGGSLYEYDREYVPGWCPTCELMFCEKHWSLPTGWKHDDAVYDCPRGHRHAHFRSLEDFAE